MTTESEPQAVALDETAIDPAMPIIDPHHHLWDYPGSRYFLDEFTSDASGAHNIVETVFVECLAMYRKDGPPRMKPVGETEFVRGMAAMSASGKYGTTAVAAGIVGFADLALGDAVEPVLEAHLAAGGARFKGIRHAAGWHASPDVPNGHTFPPEGLLRDSRFRKGFAQLRKHGLSFDACAYHTQLGEVADLAATFPETSIILDHAGTPIGIGPYAPKRMEVFDDWKHGMADLARHPNVTVKLGGLCMDICGFGWSQRTPRPTSEEVAETLSPYCLSAIDLFGPDRCMFESNFPVDKVACSYTVLWNAFKRIATPFSPAEKAALFYDTAARVYRLTA